MEIYIQRELKDICEIRKWLSNDMLEAYIEYARVYSKECWLLLQKEFLRRMEYEISIY